MGLSTTELGKLYLRDKYGVSKAFLFIGRVKGHEPLYQALKAYGYELVFKEVVIGPGGKIKGNVDAELVLHAMIEFPNYDTAVIVTSDGDFACLVEYLRDKNKLEAVLSPSPRYCSALLKRASRKAMRFFNDLRERLAYRE